jgi:hypothetical protein
MSAFPDDTPGWGRRRLLVVVVVMVLVVVSGLVGLVYAVHGAASSDRTPHGATVSDTAGGPAGRKDWYPGRQSCAGDRGAQCDEAWPRGGPDGVRPDP